MNPKQIVDKPAAHTKPEAAPGCEQKAQKQQSLAFN